MKKFCLAALLTVVAFSSASAVELKNIRPCFGPMGATRHETKLLPGDVLFMSYDIEALSVDAKTGKASYVTILELLDAEQKVLFKKETPNEVMPQLGGTRMPGDLHVIMGQKQAPGKYAIRLTVHDKYGKDAKAFKFDFDVIAEAFGMVGVIAPAVGFPGQSYRTDFALVNLTLDAKDKPNVEVNINILDAGGKLVTPSVQMLLPRDLAEDSDLKKANFVPLTYPIYLNRAGTYTIEIQASDKLSKRQVQLRYPLTVIDINHLTGK